MIARQDGDLDRSDVWAKLAAPLPSSAISWRQDGKPTARDGKYFARFVCYVEAGTVRDRLDSTCPGEWDLTLDVLPTRDITEEGSSVRETEYNFKGRLNVLGVIREDVGTGRDYKSASTDAFKRAAVRFGIGHELYAFEQNWVEVDGDGKNAKPVEDPGIAYERRYGKGAPTQRPLNQKATDATATLPNDQPAPSSSMLTDTEIISCPKCGGRMWDNRLTKRNPKAPDYKCQNRSCDGVIWPAKEIVALGGGATSRNDRRGHERATSGSMEARDEFPNALRESDDDLPF